MLQENLIHNVKRELAVRGWTQRQLASQSGVSCVALSRMLSGQHAPTLDTCERIAKALGISAEKLLEKIFVEIE